MLLILLIKTFDKKNKTVKKCSRIMNNYIQWYFIALTSMYLLCVIITKNFCVFNYLSIALMCHNSIKLNHVVMSLFSAITRITLQLRNVYFPVVSPLSLYSNFIVRNKPTGKDGERFKPRPVLNLLPERDTDYNRRFDSEIAFHM